MIRITIPIFFICFALVGKAQLSNSGFETVHITSTDTVPDNWALQEFGSSISTNAHSGTYAVSAWNWYWYGPGLVVNGAVDFFMVPIKGDPFLYGGEPISFKPLALTGFYLYDTSYTQSQDDSALVQVTLSRYNVASHQREAVGFGEVLLPYADQYKPFAANVHYSSALMPDTIAVSLRSSITGMCSMATSGTCLYFTMDDLALSTLSGMVDFNDKSALVNVYPNPAQHLLNIDATHFSELLVSCTVTNLNGSVVMQQALNENKTGLDVSALEPGFYFYQLKNQHGQVMHTGKTEIVR